MHDRARKPWINLDQEQMVRISIKARNLHCKASIVMAQGRHLLHLQGVQLVDAGHLMPAHSNYLQDF